MVCLVAVIILASGNMAQGETGRIGNIVSSGNDPNKFPFTIKNSRFYLNNESVFLNIIGYQPLEPGKKPWDEQNPERERFSKRRLKDDLRRLKAFQGGSEPVILRLYPQPTPREPNRLPKFFYDEVRTLGFWIIRDIFFDQNFCDDKNVYEERGRQQINAVIKEVMDANALDLIFAWEIGSEFQYEFTDCWDHLKIKEFIEKMCDYLKSELHKLDDDHISIWVTWSSYPPYDPLYTDGNPLEPNNLDYISYNVYSYHPERLRDHQAGPVTGTPYQGYLAVLKNRYPAKPLVISETGLSDSNLIVNQFDLRPWYPNYRYGGMDPNQVTAGLADRYWDARLLSLAEDPNIVVAGLGIFEWNDEWWKAGNDWEPEVDNNLPEEHFGLAHFKIRPNQEGYQLRYKLQQETIRELYTLNFTADPNILFSVVPEADSLPVGETTWIRAVVSDQAQEPIKFRWETNRGYIIGDCSKVKFYTGDNYLGPAKVTVVAIDANNNVDSSSTNIEIYDPNQTNPNITILTLSERRASGYVSNMDPNIFKVVCYLHNWQDVLEAKPYLEMKSIWIDKMGYWWTPVWRNPDEELICWIVPKNWPQPDNMDVGSSPDVAVAEGRKSDTNDSDNDLLPDWWENKYFGGIATNDRYNDPDEDMAYNLEEFVRGTNPTDPNDDDQDGLWDNWEYHYFGSLEYDPNDDPDHDGLNNLEEMQAELHPSRDAADRDRDGLPDIWEMRWFGNLNLSSSDNFDQDCYINLDEYELGLDPNSCMGDFDVNCQIDMIDYSIFANHWLETNCQSKNWCDKADLDKNGRVDLLDFKLFYQNWLWEW